jgi:hypothetical protein
MLEPQPHSNPQVGQQLPGSILPTLLQFVSRLNDLIVLHSPVETLDSFTIRFRLASGAALARHGYCDGVVRAIEERELHFPSIVISRCLPGATLNSRTIWNASRAAVSRLRNRDGTTNAISKVSTQDAA